MGEREWNAHPITQKASKFSRLVSWPRIFPTCLVNIHLDTIDRECNRAYLLFLSDSKQWPIFSLLLPLNISIEREDISRKRGGYSLYRRTKIKKRRYHPSRVEAHRFERRRKRGVSVGARWATREMKESEKVREEGDTRGGQSRLKMQSG